jgi:cytochrome c oxidase cbb3-type subunit 3
MALEERDPYTGKLTTGHDWNGIKELDTPIPRVVLLFLAVTTAFAVVWTILYPAWPTITSYTKGVLGIDQRISVAESIAAATAERANWTGRIAAEDYPTLQADPALMQIVAEAGATLFGDNCAACHGMNATGGPGYPNLVAAPTLWGDDATAIAETIRVGINSGHPETRFSQMLAFGRDQMLDRAGVGAVVTYVRSLSDPSVAEPDGAGAQIFADNCAGCHGETGTGITDVGAPNLADDFWIYGGDPAAIYSSVHNGRQGHMPHWEDRLSEVERKLLTLYVLELRAGQS